MQTNTTMIFFLSHCCWIFSFVESDLSQQNNQTIFSPDVVFQIKLATVTSSYFMSTDYESEVKLNVVPFFFHSYFRFIFTRFPTLVFTFVWYVCFESAGTQFSRSLQFFHPPGNNSQQNLSIAVQFRSISLFFYY